MGDAVGECVGWGVAGECVGWGVVGEVVGVVDGEWVGAVVSGDEGERDGRKIAGLHPPISPQCSTNKVTGLG